MLKSFHRAAIFSASLAFFAGCGEVPQPPAPPPPKVIVTTVGEQQINPYQQFIGRVRAVEDVTIVARTSGYLEARPFHEGEMVEKGEVLFTLDQKEYKIEVQRAEATLNLAKAELTAAERNFKRLEPLAETNAVSKRDFDEAINRRDQAIAAVAEAEAALDRANYDLDQTQVRAPFTGRAGQTKVSIGDFITTQQELTTLVTIDPMHVYIDIAERAISDFQLETPTPTDRRKAIENTAVKLYLPNGHLYQEVGKFDFFDNRINDRTGALRGRAVFKNVHDLLSDGQFVTVQIEQQTKSRALLIPLAAIQQDQLGPYVMKVMPDSTVAQQRVELGSEFGVDVAIQTGLNDGEAVVVEGLLKIRHGMKVEAIERTAIPGTDQSVRAGADEAADDAEAALPKETDPSAEAAEDAPAATEAKGE